MQEHPIGKTISSVEINFGGETYTVGRGGVTRIEACEKSGMYSPIPYLRVWQGEDCVAEYCQHNVIGITFETTEIVAAREALEARERQRAAWIADGKCGDCGNSPCDCIPF